MMATPKTAPPYDPRLTNAEVCLIKLQELLPQLRDSTMRLAQLQELLPQLRDTTMVKRSRS
jgi:hypothetical protein